MKVGPDYFYVGLKKPFDGRIVGSSADVPEVAGARIGCDPGWRALPDFLVNRETGEWVGLVVGFDDSCMKEAERVWRGSNRESVRCLYSPGLRKLPRYRGCAEGLHALEVVWSRLDVTDVECAQLLGDWYWTPEDGFIGFGIANVGEYLMGYKLGLG